MTARAITYYLDVSNECTRRITQVDGALKAICSKLYGQKIVDRTSKDLAEQCVKLLEHVCSREPLGWDIIEIADYLFTFYFKNYQWI